MTKLVKLSGALGLAAVLTTAMSCGSSGGQPDGQGGSGLTGIVGNNSGAGGTGASIVGGTGGSVSGPPLIADGCADVFDDNNLQEFSVDISDAEWQAMEAEFQNLAALESGQDFTVYHPITFHYGTETVTDAAIKLHGQSSWLLTVMFDKNPKMQFSVSFNQYNASSKFHGLSKLVFDMPREDLTYMHDRLSHHWMRQIGMMAGCTASARLNINGAYYGLYVLEENVSGHVVGEFFPNNPNGDLWKGAEVAETNQAAPNWDRLTAFKNAKDLASISQIVDIQSSLPSWGAEALLYDGDGYYGGFHNFYIYDQGAPGFVFLPQDTDSTFDWLVQFDLVGSTGTPDLLVVQAGAAGPHARRQVAAGPERPHLAREVRRRHRDACWGNGTCSRSRDGSTPGGRRSSRRPWPIRTSGRHPTSSTPRRGSPSKRWRRARPTCRRSSTASTACRQRPPTPTVTGSCGATSATTRTRTHTRARRRCAGTCWTTTATASSTRVARPPATSTAAPTAAD